MSLIVPLLPQLLSYETRQSVDGVELVFTLQWRERLASWFLSIQQADVTPILTGRRIVADWSPTMRLTTSLLPDGLFVIARQGDGDQDPGRDELGTDVLLYFIPTAELQIALGTSVSTVRKVVIP